MIVTFILPDCDALDGLRLIINKPVVPTILANAAGDTDDDVVFVCVIVSADCVGGIYAVAVAVAGWIVVAGGYVVDGGVVDNTVVDNNVVGYTVVGYMVVAVNVSVNAAAVVTDDCVVAVVVAGATYAVGDVVADSVLDNVELIVDGIICMIVTVFALYVLLYVNVGVLLLM